MSWKGRNASCLKKSMGEKMFLDSSPLSADTRKPHEGEVTYHQEALGWDPASSSIPISSFFTKMSGILWRTKLPKKSPIPAQPRGRYLTGHTLHWTLLLGSPWAHKQYSNPGVPQTKSLFLLHFLYTILEMNMHHLLKNKQEKSLPTDVVLWKLKYLCKHRQG